MIRLADDDKLQIIPAAIELPSHGSFGPIGLHGYCPITSKPRKIPIRLPPKKIIRKTIVPDIRGWLSANFFKTTSQADFLNSAIGYSICL